MIDYTRSPIKDEDISIGLIERILTVIAVTIAKNNSISLTDINIICEDVFGMIFNRLYGWNLKTLEARAPAVDLVDSVAKVAVQVTSQDSPEKITDTIEKFKKYYADNYDRLIVLVLQMKDHKYRKEEDELSSDNKFIYSRDVINLRKLIDDIEEKDDHNLLVDIYQLICMLIDSGRLTDYSIVNATRDLTAEPTIIDAGNSILWNRGYGDVRMWGRLPVSYNDSASCLVVFRNSNLKGADFTFSGKKLENICHFTDEEFEKEFSVGRDVGDYMMFADLNKTGMYNTRVYVNAYTLKNLYKLFREFGEQIDIAYKELNNKYGLSGFEKVDDKYKLMTLSKEECFNFIEFANNHNCRRYEANKRMNVFEVYNHCHEEYRIELISNFNKDAIKRAELFIIPNQTVESFDLLWYPGWIEVADERKVDNEIIWKADYTKEWIEKKIISKIRTGLKKCLF